MNVLLYYVHVRLYQLCIAVYVLLSYVIITLYLYACVMDGKRVLFMRLV